jgi:hypothetical protein
MTHDHPETEVGSTDPGPVDDVVEAGPANDVDATPQEGPRVSLPVAVPVTVALVLGLAIGLIGGWLLPRPGDSSADSPADSAALAGATATPGVSPGSGTEPVTVLNPTTPSPVEGGPKGSRDLAGLVIGTEGQLVEVFEDYVCPFCARFELSSGAQLRQAALDGEFRLVVHPIAFLTEDSPRASNASACVFEHDDLDTWASFHEAVYAQQDPSETAGQYTNEVLLGVADEVGASSSASACIEDGDFLEWVATITEQAFQRGVRGTPTLAVDGTLTDVAPFVQ